MAEWPRRRLMASKRRFGRVRQLPSKQWQARYPDADGILRPAPQTFLRKSDAERWLMAVEAEKHRGTFLDPRAGRITVGEWAQRWLEAASGHLKIKTRAGYESLLKTKIMPRFGEVSLAAMKPIMVSEWDNRPAAPRLQSVARASVISPALPDHAISCGQRPDRDLAVPWRAIAAHAADRTTHHFAR